MNDLVTEAVALARISVPKAGDVLAEQLRARIRSGEFSEGQVLPPERELVVQTGLSRTSVREALRILELEGLIETRPGRNGGSRVRRPVGADLSRHIELFIWGRQVGFAELHDVREALEALGAEGAARRRTETDLAELLLRTEAVEAAVNSGGYLEANLAWHMAVVRASHNDLLIGIMNALSNAIHQATASDAFDSPAVRAATLKIHRAVLAAIVEGDAEAARRRMARHVSAARQVAVDWTTDMRTSSARRGSTDTPGSTARRGSTNKGASPGMRASTEGRASTNGRVSTDERVSTDKGAARGRAPTKGRAASVRDRSARTDSRRSGNRAMKGAR
jgi:DNA-binding FadR family transcriptional regulator